MSGIAYRTARRPPLAVSCSNTGCHHLQLIMTSWSHAGRPRLVGRRRCGAGCLNGRVGGRPTARYFVLTRRCRRLKPARSACGAHDVIGEFLAESVLDTLEPEIADFLLATSITERTCGALASALSEQPRGLAMLEDVAHRGLFLQRIDNDPE